jgi:hypothetical protein
MDAMKQVFDLGVLKPLEQVTQPASLFRVFCFSLLPGDGFAARNRHGGQSI